MNNKVFFRGLILMGLMAATSAQAQSKYGWRGPENNGSYPDKGLLAQWPADGPQVVFEVTDAGKGYSSPQVADGKIYLTGLNDDQSKEILSCYTLDGKKVYTVEYGSPWRGSYPETRTTPTYDNGKLYVISGQAEIVCLNAADGKIIWKVDGGSKYARKTGNWGTSECPLVFDNKVIYTPCGDQTTMVALNKDTGAEIWKTRALGDKSGYVSPILITYKGKKQIVGSTCLTAFGVDPETGEIQWTFDDWGPKHYGNSSRFDNIAPNSALYKDGRIFFCHGYDINGFQLQLADDLKSVKLTWRTETLDTHHGGYVLVDGYIYGSNWVNNNNGNWCCLDWNTGETKYETAWQGKGKGSIITADGKLFCYDERRGTLGLAKATPEKFEVVSEYRITKGSGPYWAHPSISNGVLYVRHAEAFYALKIK
ncbi:MAG: PQQ-binding-like beta-propeller repeat protein [Bacteroidaceae bacterium]|nr:PQQ-binding-like beta-propeller repeat protein [Bacteroidaceae bacterium]